MDTQRERLVVGRLDSDAVFISFSWCPFVLIDFFDMTYSYGQRRLENMHHDLYPSNQLDKIGRFDHTRNAASCETLLMIAQHTCVSKL